MLDKAGLEKKMEERGFIVYAYIGSTKIQFITDSMYKQNDTGRRTKPIINIIVDLENGEFNCIYNVEHSINTLQSPACSPVMNDTHFDRIVSVFESQAKWLSLLKG